MATFTREQVAHFGGGPSGLPTDVLQSAAASLLNHDGAGIGLAEISHRSATCETISDGARADLASFLNIPDDYEVIPTQGGGSGQFAAVVYHMVGVWVAKEERAIRARLAQESSSPDDSAVLAQLKARVACLRLDYLITGNWSNSAATEASNLLGSEHVNIAADARNIVDSASGQPRATFGGIPPESEWTLSPPQDTALVYYCDNETVYGVEFPAFPAQLASDETLVVADMSSNILTRSFDVRKFALVFFSAQKNLGSAGVTFVVIRKSLLAPTLPLPPPKMMQQLGLPVAPAILKYEQGAKSKPIYWYNTMSLFDTFIAAQVVKKLLITFADKVAGQENITLQKAKLLYDALEKHRDFYRVMPDKAVRSRINIIFFISRDGQANDQLQQQFLQQAGAQGLLGLKGHRSIGGMRASNYNSLSIDAAKRLVAFLHEFAQSVQEEQKP